MQHLLKGICLLLALSLIQFTNAQLPVYKTDKALTAQLTRLVKDFHGTIGIYVVHTKRKRQAAINADTVFPTASIVKVPILAGLFNRLEKDSLQYHQELMYRDSIKYGGSGLAQFFKDSVKTPVHVLAALMMSYSDNTTSLWNQALAGGGATINDLLASFGFVQTRVNSRTPGREKIRAIYGWGQTTPREMALLLLKIRQHEIVSPAASEEMYRLMTHTYYDKYALSQLPPYVQSASKQGMVDESRSELVMVNAPHGDYVFYVATNNNKDTSWKNANEAWQLTRKISALLWNYFEPHYGWTAPPGTEKYFEQ